MTVINTNVSATLASNAVSRNERAMSTAMERLSTGKRINSAADDAAGQAIASRMSSQVKGLEQAARNANDANLYGTDVRGCRKGNVEHSHQNERDSSSGCERDLQRD